MEKKIRLKEKLESDLALRSTAKKFFKEIEGSKNKSITLDFKGIKSITRSFAHEYLIRKENSNKNIEELNVSKNIEKMFKMVQESRKKKRNLDVDTSSIQVISI